MSYGELAQLSVDIALFLSRIGVGKGDVICICSEKRMEFIPTMTGVLCVGATFTTADISCRNGKRNKSLHFLIKKYAALQKNSSSLNTLSYKYDKT